MDGQFRVDYEHQREASHACDRHKVFDWIVVEVPVYERIGRERRVRPHQERIAIRGLMMDVRGSQRAIRSGASFDDDWLAEQRTELLGDNAANRVAGAARTKHG